MSFNFARVDRLEGTRRSSNIVGAAAHELKSLGVAYVGNQNKEGTGDCEILDLSLLVLAEGQGVRVSACQLVRIYDYTWLR